MSILKECLLYGKRVIIFIVYLLSEFEAHVSEPYNPHPLRLLFLRMQGVEAGKQLWIGPFTTVVASGLIVIGDRCAIGSHAKIEIQGSSLSIGDDFLGASGLTIVTGDHELVNLEPKHKSIKIGNRVFCGVNVTILPGTVIEDDVVIGAGSICLGRLKSGYVYHGRPAAQGKAFSRDLYQFWSAFS